jgi:Domain of unknown function(DUF2779)
MTLSPFLSKSKYLSGLQCHKLLWHYYNAKDEIPAVDTSTQAIFDQGHIVGEYAKKLFPDGVEVGKGVKDFHQVLELSAKAVALRKPLFEAAFKSNNAFARADILNPVGKDQWDIIEVKSSTEVKNINLHDLALQRFAYEGAGLKIARCHILHINNKYVRHGDIEPKKLFKQVDVTKEVNKLSSSVLPNLEEMLRVIGEKKFPEVEIGPQCNDPYDCPLHDKCWAFLPENNPLTLYYFKKVKAFELIHSGNLDIISLPKTAKLSDKQEIQVEALRSGKPHIESERIKEFLGQLTYPLFYLDFETMATAIPLFDDVRPYQQIPFQFSVHIVDKPGNKPRHESYLADGKNDPRPEILKRLKGLLRDQGSIVAYNASFETSILKVCCEVFKEYSSWFGKIESRIVDLLAPFKSFYYYHPDQHGSASIKSVLPVLTGKGYEGMEIAEGGTASQEYLRVTYGDVEAKERENVRRDLENYCKLDTEGMTMIVDALHKILQ